MSRLCWIIVFLCISGCSTRLLHLGKAPRAVLTVEYLHTWNCIPGIGCTITGTLHNVGTGCASHVSGILHLYNESNHQVGDVYYWKLPLQQVVDPGDDITWRIEFVPVFVAQEMRTYSLDADWVSTRCDMAAGWLGRKHKK